MRWVFKIMKKGFILAGLCDTVMDRTEVTGNKEGRGMGSGRDPCWTHAGC